jgi:uncharacterized membrane protein
MNRPSFGLLLAVSVVALTAIVYGGLPLPPSPESVIFGESSAPGLTRGPGVFLGPGLIVGLWMVLWLFPRVDPWREPGAGGGSTYWIVGNLVLLVMSALHLLVVGLALGWPVDPLHLAVVVPAFFLLAVGSYLPTVPANWLLGVRTPWTLGSERVWQATHRLAGRTFVAGGILLLGAVFLAAEQRLLVALTGLAVAGGIPAAYSYLLWRRLER